MKVNNNRATIIQWAVLNKKSKRLIQWVATFLLSSCLAIEKRLQRKLTQLPNVYHQDTRNNNELTSLLSAILLRRLRPSLFIGTRSILNTISVLLPRPSSSQRFREMITVSYDGAQIGLDWEIPIDDHETMKGVKDSIILKKGPIKYPVVLILHGVNNDTSLGYMRGVMHSCTEKGYIAAGMNYRGSGGTNLTTPRLHNAAYTNDLRDVVHRICSRLDKDTPLILVGYSMGGNTLVKYLGECGISNSLPVNVIGAASLGNPFKIDHEKLEKPWSHILRIGAKKSLLQHRKQLKNCPHYNENMNKALLSPTLADISSISAQHYIRNEPVYPFETKIGYNSAQEYWKDASSYRHIAHVKVPLIVAFASDDDIANTYTTKYMNYGLSNPNVIFVNTASGGHLGWHHAMKNNPFGSWKFFTKNEENKGWGNGLVIKFIEVIIKKQYHERIAERKKSDREILLKASFEQGRRIKSRL